MRNYTYIEGARFLVANIYRSQRFDVDRLDLNWVDGSKPEFTRGLRVVDHKQSEIHVVHGERADNLIFSLAAISSGEDGSGYGQYDAYLLQSIRTGDYLIESPARKCDGALH